MNSEHYQCSASSRAEILDLAKELGAVAAGFAKAEPLPDDVHGLYLDWIAEGKHAGMAYLDRYHDIRRNPDLLHSGAKSILCLAFSYRPSVRHPLIADYALGEDYHTALRKRLELLAAKMRECVEGSKTRICIDSAPIRERYWATRAGLGFIGLNNQLIIPGIGSRVFLVEIVWTASVEASQPCPQQSCQGCRACIKACPGQALDGIGALDARRCYSYITIESRDELPDSIDLRNKRIYGCDICQDVCPHNRQTVDIKPIPEFSPIPQIFALTLDDIAAMDDTAFRSTFRRSAIFRAKHLPALARKVKG